MHAVSGGRTRATTCGRHQGRARRARAGVTAVDCRCVHCSCVPGSGIGATGVRAVTAAGVAPRVSRPRVPIGHEATVGQDADEAGLVSDGAVRAGARAASADQHGVWAARRLAAA